MADWIPSIVVSSMRNGAGAAASEDARKTKHAATVRRRSMAPLRLPQIPLHYNNSRRPASERFHQDERSHTQTRRPAQGEAVHAGGTGVGEAELYEPHTRTALRKQRHGPARMRPRHTMRERMPRRLVRHSS